MGDSGAGTGAVGGTMVSADAAGGGIGFSSPPPRPSSSVFFFVSFVSELERQERRFKFMLGVGRVCRGPWSCRIGTFVF